MKKKVSVVSGYILEEEPSLTLEELCKRCQIPTERIIKCVDHGVISPYKGATVQQWRFHRDTMVRLDKAQRLKFDLGVNLPGTALALELLDEIEGLLNKLNQLEQGITPSSH